MSEFKGTKGEWSLDIRNVRCMIHSGESKAVCDVWGSSVSNVTSEEMIANAKLIACAPEMLEFLTRINETGRLTIDDGIELEQLIKKATK